jgi:hypothetical protein
MSGGDIYELSKLLGHSNIKMTERYADLARAHIVKTGSVSREIWSKLKPQSEGREIAGNWATQDRTHRLTGTERCCLVFRKCPICVFE